MRLRVVVVLDMMDEDLTHPRDWLRDHKQELWDVIIKGSPGFKHVALPAVCDAQTLARMCHGPIGPPIALVVEQPARVWRKKEGPLAMLLPQIPRHQLLENPSHLTVRQASLQVGSQMDRHPSRSQRIWSIHWTSSRK